MKKFANLINGVLLTACLTGGAMVQATASHAQIDLPAPDESPVIVVQGMKDPTLIHYGEMRSALDRFGRMPLNPRVHMVLRLIAKERSVDVDRIRVILRGDDDYLREIRTYPGGRLAVPNDPEAFAKHADFVIYARHGSVRTVINVVVDIAGSEKSYRQLMDDMKQANDGERLLMSPAQRARFADANALVIHFADRQGASVTIPSSTKGEIVLRPNSKGLVTIPFDQAVYDENPTVRIQGNAPYGMVTNAQNIRWKSK
jgi:hypothetical protein